MGCFIYFYFFKCTAVSIYKQNQKKWDTIFFVLNTQFTTHTRHHTINWSKNENVKQFIYNHVLKVFYFLVVHVHFVIIIIIKWFKHVVKKKSIYEYRLYFIESCNNVAFLSCFILLLFDIFYIYYVCTREQKFT